MGSVSFALSIHHFINSVGSDAGFASIIGLAILVLLYFAQARETASLRNHAHDAAERIQQLEARIAQLTRGQAAQSTAACGQAAVPGAQAARTEGAPAVSRVAAATAGAGAASRGVAAVATAIPSAPAGVAAPALTAATRLIPIPEPAREPVGVPAGGGSAPVLAGGGGEPVPAGGQRVPAAAAMASPAPATVAGGANGSRRGATVPPPPTRQTPSPRAQLRQQGTTGPSRRPPAGPGGRPPRGGGSMRRRPVLGVLLPVLVVGAVVAGVLALTSNSGHPNTTTDNAASGTARRHRTAAAFKTSQVTVAVLNGTSTTNLAHDIGQRLAGAGYQEGNIATATDQTHATTIVAYLPGFRRDALAVAGTLKLNPSAVQPVDDPTKTVACPPPSTCQTDVVVTVGSDLATTQ
jgi:hypothetical protein